MIDLTSPEISIVMPLYNAERYLKEALESIKMQTFENYELICVNDFSSDNTQKVIDLYAQKDERIKVLKNTERRGAAYSRNKGLDMALGKYIIFLDGDDLFDESMLEQAFEAIESKRIDIVCFDYVSFTSMPTNAQKRTCHSKRFVRQYCDQSFQVSDMKICDFTDLNTAPWNKLYRTEFLKENKLEFQDLPCCNDVYFVLLSFFLTENMIFLNSGKALVCFRRHDTVTKIGNNQNPICLFYALEKVQKELVNRKLFDRYYEHYYAQCFWMLWSTYKTTKDNRQKTEFYHFIRKKGIKLLWRGKENFFDQISPYMQSQWNNWFNLESGEMWGAPDLSYRFKLSCFEKEITTLLNSIQCRRKKSALWGMGVGGIALKKYCREKKISIDLLFDISSEKEGTLIDGVQVQDPRKGLDGVEVIIVTVKGICSDVREMVAKSGNVLPEIIDFWESVDT